MWGNVVLTSRAYRKHEIYQQLPYSRQWITTRTASQTKTLSTQHHAHGRLQSLNAILRAAHLNGVHEAWSLLLSAPRGKMIITARQCISSRHDVLYHPPFAPHLFRTEVASVSRMACPRRRKQYDGQRNWGSLSAVESHQTRHSGSPTRHLSSCPCSSIPPANLDRLRTHHFPTPRIGPEWW